MVKRMAFWIIVCLSLVGLPVQAQVEQADIAQTDAAQNQADEIDAERSVADKSENESSQAEVTSPTSPTIMTLQSTIKGNQEQPKVLTIVPWQPPSEEVGIERVIYQRIATRLSPLEPDELKRQLAFFQVQQQSKKQGASTKQQ